MTTRYWLRLAHVTRLLFRQSFARKARLIATAASVVFPLIMMIVWDAVPATSSDRLSQSELFAYFGAVAFCTTLTASRAAFAWEAAARSGQLEAWMLLPLSPWLRLFLTDVAERMTSGLFVIPVLVVLSLGFGRGVNPWSALAGCLVMLGAYILAFVINSAIGVTAIVGLRTRRLHEVFWGVGALLSGLVAPLEYLPAWLRTVSDFTPYPLLVGIPASLISGTASVERIPEVIASLGFWLVLATAAARSMWVRLRTTPIANLS